MKTRFAQIFLTVIVLGDILVPYSSFSVIKNKKMNIAGLLEWNESGQTATTTLVCFLYW